MKNPDTGHLDTVFLLKPLFFIAVLACLSIGTFLLIYQHWMNSLLERVETQRRQDLVQIVSIARNAVEPVMIKVRSGKIAPEEAILQIRALVRTMTYNDQYGNNYIFMSSYDGTMLVQPFEPEKEMTNQWDLKDAHGVFIIRELARAAKAAPSGSFVHYNYHLPGIHETQEKLAYVVGLPELACYIGTGMYMQRAVREQKEILNKVKYGSIGFLLAILIPVSVSVAFIINRNRLLLAEIRMRENTEEELRKEREMFFSILYNAPYGIFMTDPGGNVMLVNPEAGNITGYTQEDIPTGRVLLEKLYHDPGYRKNVIRTWKEDLSSKSIDRTFSVHCKDGSVKELEFRTFLLPDRKAVTMFLDITQRKRTEEEKKNLESQLRQSQKMEAVGTLAGGIAHDFNNILTALIGYGNLLQMKMEKDDPLRVYVDQIIASSNKAASLTQGLLAFSRKQTIELRPNKVNAIIRGMEKLLARLLTEDIELRIDLSDQDLSIMADIAQIDQVLLNLTTNARDAMPRGGTLTIATRDAGPGNTPVMGHDEGRPGRYVLISVSDTGHGMNMETYEKIFDPFFTTKEVGKGTGLGLSIVYGIIKQHNGYIDVKSETNKGTTFSIYLPVVNVAAEEERAAPRVMEKGTETILIAEDNKEVRNLAREVLAMAGYTVIEATDGEDVIQKFKEHKNAVSLVILDVVMPKKNGKEAFEEIGRIRSDMRVLFTSGYTGDIVLDKGIHDAEVDFIPKPLMPVDLLKKVREMLDR